MIFPKALYLLHEGKPKKKKFFSGPTTKAFTFSGPRLSGHRNFWAKIYIYFFLNSFFP